LRPLEFFNLTSKHGHTCFVHDDFYDYDTGEATQPEMPLTDVEKFPFPQLEEIKNDLKKLIDYSFVQHFTSKSVIELLLQFDKSEVLRRIDEKVKYDRAINYKAYEIISKVLGRQGENWIKDQWANRKENEIQIFAEAIINCVAFEEAFQMLTNELENGNDKFLSDNASALVYFKSNDALDWIEKVSPRIKNVSYAWGQLAASSKFTWERANNWLTSGRPLSLIALDALIYCTDNGDRLNQSMWLRELKPVLTDRPKADIISNRLKDFLITDSVPRAKNSVEVIIKNLFDLTT